MIITLALLMGLFGSSEPRDFVEVVQEVQLEYEYSPTVGRHAEPAAEPFVPVRYLTPAQRAEPIIVEPEPKYVSATPNASSESETIARPAAGETDPYNDQDLRAPSYLTSDFDNASATGSSAYADYRPTGD